MAEDLQRIQRFVDALVRQERRLIAGTALVRLAVLLATLVVLSVLAAWGHWDRSVVLMVLVGFAAGGLWLAVWVPMLTRWRPAGDRMRQARKVEQIQGDLRGRLVTAVGHTHGATGRESEALLGLVARRAAQAVAKVPAKAVHPTKTLWRTLIVAGLSWLIALPAAFIAPGGPAGLLRFWGSGLDARAAVAAMNVSVQEEHAWVGDLVISYVYPDYTGLDPHRVTNTTGSVEGPPGTVVQIEARTQDPVEAAGLVAYDHTLEARVSEDGQELEAKFRIADEPSTWQLVLYRGAEPERSAPFDITPTPDLAPDVILEAQSVVLEVAVDQSFGLQWRARDDYGVTRAVLQVDQDANNRVLYEADVRRAEVFDQLSLRPADLGLGPGAEVDLMVAAWDNDTVSGSKMGVSQPIRLVVLGAMGQDARRAERHKELEALMVPVLARFLTEDWPPGDTGRDVVRWGEKVARRYQPLQELVERDWRGMSDEALDRAFVNRVLTTGRDLVRYTQVAFDIDSQSRPSAADLFEVRDMRDDAIEALERALLAFLKESQMRALAEVFETAQELEEAGELLKEALSRENPEQMELLARLDQLERLFQQLQEKSARMSDGGLKQFVNLRQHEMQTLMDEIRTAIAEGRMEDARRLMQRLVEQLEALRDGIEQDLESRQMQSDETQQEANKLLEELAELEKDQRELQDQVRELREQEDSEGAEEAAALWAKIDQLTLDALSSGTRYRTQLDDAERPFYERERASEAVEALEVLRGAVRARDVRGSREAVAEASHLWIVVQRTAFGLFERAANQEGPRPEVARTIERQLLEIEQLLEMLDRASDGLSADALEQAEQMRDQQRELQNRLEQARQQVEDVMRQMPVEPEGMPEALQEASERMEQAGEDLGDGRAMAAEGSQGVAAERIRRARSALRQAIRATQQMGQQGQGQGQGEGEGEGEGDQRSDESGNGDQLSGKDIYIPGREAYESPEAYRRALLEGMQGDVPEAYRAWKKRYYEELVQQ